MAKPEGVKQLGETFWYITKDGVAWKNMPSKGGWTKMPLIKSGYYNIKKVLYSPQRAVWEAWHGSIPLGYQVILKKQAEGVHLDNLELARIERTTALGKKAMQQRSDLIRAYCRRLDEQQRLLLSTFKRHRETEKPHLYSACCKIQLEIDSIVHELKGMGYDPEKD